MWIIMASGLVDQAFFMWKKHTFSQSQVTNAPKYFSAGHVNFQAFEPPLFKTN